MMDDAFQPRGPARQDGKHGGIKSLGKDPSLEMLNVAVEVSRYHANAHLVPVQGRSALPAGDGLWMRRDGEPQSGYRATPAEARTITTMGVVGVRNLFHDQPAWDQG